MNEIDIEISFDSLKSSSFTYFKTQERVIVKNCPSVDEILNYLPNLMRGFFHKFSTAICAEFKAAKKFIELSDEQFNLMIQNFLSFKRSFLISFESHADNSCIVYWRLRDKLPIYKLKIEANQVKLENFVIEFLMNFLKRNQNGE